MTESSADFHDFKRLELDAMFPVYPMVASPVVGVAEGSETPRCTRVHKAGYVEKYLIMPLLESQVKLSYIGQQ